MAPKKMPWWRFYAEMQSDRKIRRLKVEYRWLWCSILSASCTSPIRGMLLLADGVALTDHDLADVAAMPLRQVTAGLRALDEVGLIEMDHLHGAWRVVKWEDRQPTSDSSTERVRAHRQRRNDETLQERSGNGERNAPETETETETDLLTVLQTTNDLPRGPASSSAETTTEVELVNAAVELLVDRAITDARSRGTQIDNEPGYRTKTRRNIVTERWDQLAASARAGDITTAKQLADTVAPTTANGHATAGPLSREDGSVFLPGSGWVRPFTANQSAT